MSDSERHQTVSTDYTRLVAYEMRAFADSHHGTSTKITNNTLHRWADLLDPPPPLRDEVERVIFDTEADEYNTVEDAVLAVVRRHVERLDRHGFFHPMAWGIHDNGKWLDRDDVLRLLGDES